ncbi:hypothetical protein ACYCFC_02100 [Stutzerimonas sp. NM35]
MKRILIVTGMALALAGCGDSGGKKVAAPELSIDRSACRSGAADVGEVVRPVRSITLRSAPSAAAPYVINEKATQVLKETHYHNIGSEGLVYVSCTQGDFSHVARTEPEWLKGIGGWVSTKELRFKNDPDDPYEGKISEWILEDYSDSSLIDGGDSSDPAYKRFTKKTKEINEQKIAAAKKAIDSGKCQHVSSVLFMRRESVLSNMKYMVDCEEDKRLEITSGDLLSGGEIRTNSERAVSQADAMARCKELVLGKANHKNTVRFSELLGSSYYKAPVTGNVRLTLDFEAQNGLGQKIGHRAICIFEPGDLAGELTITER